MRVAFIAPGLVVGLVGLLAAGEPSPGIDFSKHIKPILAKKCAGCHGSQKQKSNLRLDTPEGISQGGDSGAVIRAGNSAESLLYKAIAKGEDVSPMPPAGQPALTAEEVALMRRWIDSGAKMTSDLTVAPSVFAPEVDPRTRHWAFQPIVRPFPPSVKSARHGKNPVDAFVLHELESRGIAPAPEADRLTLIRRVSLDLIGLPLEPAQIDEFLADTSPQAYEHLVDRLLNSPHYGERWGRVWLDQARYADSNGFTRDFGRTIWKYRDWVIDAFNRDLPFDQMTIQQLAGDLLPSATLAQRIATGFHRNTLFNEEGGTDPEQFRNEAVVDRVSTTGVVYLGLTLGCAQCHEHKYDPVSQREFYQLFAFFNNADEPLLDVPTAAQLARGEVEKRDAIRKAVAALEMELEKQSAAIKGEAHRWANTIAAEEKKKLPPNVINALNFSEQMRSEEDRKLIISHYKTLPQARKQFPLLQQINTLSATEPKFDTTLVMQERAQPRETHIHIRGDFLRHGALVSPAVPAVLPPLKVKPGTRPNRLDLARWLVSLDNPLTARVTVNRIWQKLFGRGLVETENDFGVQGARPTHPALLDWLASEFRQPTTPGARPWSFKSLHRLIVTSATYRQSSRTRTELAEIDPENKSLARQSRLRLDAELIRDVGLAVSGLLSRNVGGPSVFPPQPEGVFDFTQDKKQWNTAVGSDRYRRGMYTHLWRSSPYPAMTVFDFPDSNITCTRRNRSNTPLQSLTLANDESFLEMAQALALHVLREQKLQSPEERIRFLVRASLGRDTRPAEMNRLQRFYREQQAAFGTDVQAAEKLTPPLLGIDTTVRDYAAWTMVARVLLNLDEFITRE